MVRVPPLGLTLLKLVLTIELWSMASGQSTKNTMTYPEELIIGAVITRYPDTMNRRNDGWGWENVGSAIHIAVDKFQAAGGLIGGVQIRVFRVDDSCDKKIGVHKLIELYYDNKPDVVLGPSCSAIIAVLGYLMSYWNLPYWPYGGTEPSLENKDIQDVMVRIHATGSKIGVAFSQLFEVYGWKRVVMLTSVTYCDMGARGISNELEKQNIYIAEWIQTLSGPIEQAAIDDYLERLKLRGRIFVVCFDDWRSQQRFFERAEVKGMSSPEFVYLFYSIRGAINDRIVRPWLYERSLTAEQEAKAKPPYYFYKQVTLVTLEGDKIDEFYDEVPKRLAGPPYYDDEALTNGYKGSWQAVNLHDATLTYLKLVNDCLIEGRNYKDGRLLMNTMRNQRITGHQLQSPLLYDENADRVPNFWLWSFSPNQSKFDVAISMIMTEAKGQRMRRKSMLYWGTADGMPPPDTPDCGFHDEFCQEQDVSSALVIGVSLASVFTVLVVITVIIVVVRKQSRESELRQMLWRIQYDEIEMVKKGQAKSMTSTNSTGSDRSLSISSGMTNATEAKSQVFINIGHYKGMTVAIKIIPRDHILLQRKDLMELKQMREMNHDNINNFVGACVDPPTICYIMNYCPKGSLQDILENDDIKLDWMFKLSFISDITSGMGYLHKSALISHGNLKSGNCLVDGRWVVKISDYGLTVFKEGIEKDQSEYERYRDLLWTAPELLRMPHKPHKGTPKADVYSFSIILQEIVYRALPYFMASDSPKDIVQRIARGTDPPFRPRLKELGDDTNPTVLDLMIMCWYEDPGERPDFELCKKKILAMNGGKKIDMMGNILDKLEKYATNLEDIVNQRTSELVEEKKKTDLLLYSMMPRTIAEALKQGKKIDAELYEEVTIYFSDICGFTAISSESTPMQVVDFLNDLYTLFDDIINKHDVYKVETIGDAYMVVSGVPIPNGMRHAGEIANMALDLLSAVYTKFKLRHRPDLQMKLRIGLHTGPCAAGVVGLTMPRYCLFGDTVNTASRMESSGDPLTIHLSQQAHDALRKLNVYRMKPRGQMEIKGKGTQTTYWLLGKEGYVEPLPELNL